MIDAGPDVVWFFWPVTFALVTAPTLSRLVGQRAWGGAAGAVASLALPVIPLVLAIPVECSDGDPVLDLRIPILGVGLLGVVGWLAILSRLGERAGDSRAEADRRALVSAVLLVPLMVVELVASIVTLAVGCGDTREPLAWHLGVASAVLVVGMVRGLAGPRYEKTPAGGGRR